MEENNNSTAWKVTVVVLLLAIVGVLTWNYFGDNIKKHVDASDVPSIVSTMETAPTVDEAMKIRANQLEAWRCESVYAEIPAPIMRAIYTKLGTQESIQTYVYEYELNEPYYISMYVSEKAKISIDRNTANKIEEVGIKTKLKEKEPDDVSVSLTPGDSTL